MRLERLINLVYSAPWAIRPEAHRAIQRLLESKLAGNALFPFEADEETKPKLDIVGKVAVLNVEGTILPKASGLEAACGAFSLETFRKDLRAAAANPDVKSIVLNISSPGGVITGVPETADLIGEIEKPVFAYSNDLIASAAYWLASQANGGIFVSKSAEVGSIGVYLALLDITRAMEMEGVKLELFKAGEFKAMGIAGKPLSDAERDLLQAGVDKAYRQFISYVSAARENVKASALQGQVFDTEDAVKFGLVDGEINELDNLINYLNR